MRASGSTVRSRRLFEGGKRGTQRVNPRWESVAGTRGTALRPTSLFPPGIQEARDGCRAVGAGLGAAPERPTRGPVPSLLPRGRAHGSAAPPLLGAGAVAAVTEAGPGRRARAGEGREACPCGRAGGGATAATYYRPPRPAGPQPPPRPLPRRPGLAAARRLPGKAPPRPPPIPSAAPARGVGRRRTRREFPAERGRGWCCAAPHPLF